MIGLTLVAVGTSIPELASSVAASLQQASGIVVGNVVGLNIANIFLIPGVSGLLFPISIGEISVLLTALFMTFISTTLLSSSPQAGK
ncbi:Sodium/calcium exchanger protein [Methanosarcina sp. MTP4]|nr:Sodium/calcium exchanger protein [Methanosarcina sp. MTP4]